LSAELVKLSKQFYDMDDTRDKASLGAFARKYRLA